MPNGSEMLRWLCGGGEMEQQKYIEPLQLAEKEVGRLHQLWSEDLVFSLLALGSAVDDEQARGKLLGFGAKDIRVEHILPMAAIVLEQMREEPRAVILPAFPDVFESEGSPLRRWPLRICPQIPRTCGENCFSITTSTARDQAMAGPLWEIVTCLWRLGLAVPEIYSDPHAMSTEDTAAWVGDMQKKAGRGVGKILKLCEFLLACSRHMPDLRSQILMRCALCLDVLGATGHEVPGHIGEQFAQALELPNDVVENLVALVPTENLICGDESAE